MSFFFSVVALIWIRLFLPSVATEPKPVSRLPLPACEADKGREIPMQLMHLVFNSSDIFVFLHWAKSPGVETGDCFLVLQALQATPTVGVQRFSDPKKRWADKGMFLPE